MPTYGLMTKDDILRLETSLTEVSERFKDQPLLKVLEIGVHQGNTARGIHEFLRERNVAHEYWCQDSGKECPGLPFPEAKMAWGDSSYAHLNVPGGFHWVLIDGCHCLNHVIIDFVIYGEKVVPGGLVLLHDTAPSIAPFTHFQHGPQDRPESYVVVRQGLAMMGLLPKSKHADWELVGDYHDPLHNWGGLCVYRKLLHKKE